MKTCAALVLLASLTRLADADERTVTLDRTCVAIDDTDGLSTTDREYALALMQRVLERADLLVVASECTETYSISHEQVDGRFVIRVRSSAGKRRMTTNAMNELSEKYERMVRSLIEAKAAHAAALAAAEAAAAQAAAPEPVDNAPAVATEASAASKAVAIAMAEDAAAPDDTPAPQHDETSTFEKTDGTEYDGDLKQRMWYAMLGVSFGGGAAISGGYRRELVTTTLDITANVRNTDSGTAGASLGLELLKYRSTAPRAAFYGGGGLSFGALDKGEYAYHYSGGGLQGELTGGLQFGSKTGTRGLIQLDITLPFYQLSNDSGAKTYVAAAMVSGGLGW